MSAPPQPPEQPAAPPGRPSLVRRILDVVRRILDQGWKGVAGVCAALALLAGGITHWDTIKSALFPAGAATAATIFSHVEADISLQEYELQAQAPTPRTPSAAAVAPGESSRLRAGYRLVAYVVPASAQPAAGTPVAAATGEEPKSTESKPATSAEGQPKVTLESEKITEEAKHAEEAAAQEKVKATAEQKSAEARVQEEQKKELEAHKRAEGTDGRPAASAHAAAEEAKARTKAQQEEATVLARKREVARPVAERRVEAGKPGLVEEVLREAHLPQHCRPTCALKPTIERALKASSNNEAAATHAALAVSRGPGVRVRYKVTLTGLEHKVVVLTYALVQTSGPTPALRYLLPIEIRAVAPVHEPEVVRGTCWVPVPSGSRQYYLDLTVRDGETEVESEDTSDFP